MPAPHIQTLQSVIPSMFVAVVAVEPEGRAANRRCRIRLSTVGDAEVEDITVHMSAKRAEELGLIHH